MSIELLAHGLPLAIELAAARSRLLTVEEIGERLTDRFALLDPARRGGARRQATLRAAMDWSHELLSPPEQALLHRLSVFSGGFTLEAATAVAGDCDDAATLTALGALVDASLVTARDRGGRSRYGLLETVRQYAEQQLEPDDERAMRRAHAEHFAALAAQASQAFDRADEQRWLHWLDDELGNLHVALDWALDARQPAGQRMAGALSVLLRVRGHLTEAAAGLRRALEQTSASETALRHELLGRLGSVLLRQGRPDAAREVLEESVAIGRTLGDAAAEGESLG